MEEVVLYSLINENCWDLMHHCMLHASGNYSIYDGYGSVHYEMINDYYVYHNPMTVTTLTGCPAIAPENAHSTRKGAQEV